MRLGVDAATTTPGAELGRARVDSDRPAAEVVSPDRNDVLDAIDVPIVLIRRDFTVASFNQAAADVLGFSPTHIGLDPRAAPALGEMPDLQARCEDIFAGGSACRVNFSVGEKSFVVRIAPCGNASPPASGAVLTFTNVTAFRSSIDQAIHEREFTKAILNTVGDPIVVLDADARIQAGNRAFYSTFRISRDQMQGTPLYELAEHAFDIDRLRAGLDAMMTGVSAFECVEVDHAVAGAEPRSFVVDARPLALPRHSERRILLTFHDITARKQAEAANARLAAIVESSDDAIVGKTLDGIIVSWNAGAERVFGYRAHEVVGKSITLLIPSERQAEEPAILERIRRGERVGHFETVRRRKDGRLIDVSLAVSPVLDTSGRVIAASKIARDITERKRIEKDLSDFFENASVALHWLGPDGIILRANRRELEMLGYERDEYLGRHISEFHVDQETIADILNRLAAGEVIRDYPSQLRCKDGAVRDVVIDSSVLWENGRFVHTRCFMTDVTARKQAEESQQMLVGELQHRVRNTLATIQAIASQTLQSATAEERKSFSGRILALANAHDVLTSDNWERAPLRHVVDRALAPFQKERIAVTGPDVPLGARNALLTAMVLHELATNALKYGALSNGTGQVCLDWTVRESTEGKRLQLCWIERGGPPVREPTRKGFGSRLIERSLEETQVRFEPEGVTCTLEMAL
ncbi:MAG TPA: PAS domain S-box protein [Rhizomicrobium sp.]|jgi:PAS domain S-box-containing protein|nr:PAS domain S-box protein [Rhizomicrobium sp.]